MNKEQQYEQIISYLNDSIKENKRLHRLTLLSESVNLLKDAFPLMDWVGYYLEEESEGVLYLGPYTPGYDACEEIKNDRGVCGKAYSDGKTQLTGNVHTLPYHIACSSTTESEVVVPLLDGDKCYAVLDIDSDTKDAFDTVDVKYLEEIASLIMQVRI